MSTEETVGTRERILDAAEKLFASNGYGGTSLRSITGEAGANLAAINYYFKSKEGLLLEVLHRRIDPLNAERLSILDRLEAEGDDDPAGILRALLEPAVRLKERFGAQGDAVVTIVGRLHADPPAIAEQLFQELFQDVFRRFDRALARALPGLPDRVRILRMHFTLGSMVHIMQCGAQLKNFPCRRRQEENVDDLLQDLVAFATAGMTAPCASGEDRWEEST